MESINNVITTHKQYWKSLKFQLALPIENVLPEPLPSRGLTIPDEPNTTCESEKLAELSLTSSLDESTKSVNSKSASQLDGSLESNMANLSLDRPKCDDGIHCGTDDEDEKAECSKGVKEKEKSVSQGSKCEGSLQGGSSRCGEGSSKPEQRGTLVDYLAENMQAIADGEMFAVIPMAWCPHLESLYALPSDVRFEQGVKCVECDETVENWVCLHCFIVSCFLSFFN